MSASPFVDRQPRPALPVGPRGGFEPRGQVREGSGSFVGAMAPPALPSFAATPPVAAGGAQLRERSVPSLCRKQKVWTIDRSCGCERCEELS